MKIDRIIISCDDNPYYSDFAMPVAKAWKHLIPEANVVLAYTGADVKTFEEMVHPDYNGVYLVKWPLIDGIPKENFAKVLRTITATLFPNEYCLISDVDMLPLQRKYFVENSEFANEENIVFYTSELEGVDEGKYPICYMLATGRVWTKLVNPQELPVQHLLQSWSGLDEFESIDRLPFSDEGLYRRLFRKNGKLVQKVSLDRFHQDKRICRSNWQYDPKILSEDEYIDSHLPRPLITNTDKVFPLFLHSGVVIDNNPAQYE